MKVKRSIAGLAALVLVLVVASPALAASLGVSPSNIELEVPSNSSITANLKVHYYSGDIEVSLIDIPLRVEPQILHVNASDEPEEVELTVYGDNSLGSRIYDGYIRFTGLSEGGTVAIAVQVRAKITNIVEGETPLLAPIEESQPPVAEEPTEEIRGLAPAPPPEEAPAPPAPPGGAPAETTELNIPLLAGIAAGTLILMTIIVVVARRRRY